MKTFFTFYATNTVSSIRLISRLYSSSHRLILVLFSFAKTYSQQIQNDKQRHSMANKRIQNFMVASCREFQKFTSAFDSIVIFRNWQL